jgi:hypothetical protein
VAAHLILTIMKSHKHQASSPHWAFLRLLLVSLNVIRSYGDQHRARAIPHLSVTDLQPTFLAILLYLPLRENVSLTASDSKAQVVIKAK